VEETGFPDFLMKPQTCEAHMAIHGLDKDLSLVDATVLQHVAKIPS